MTKEEIKVEGTISLVDNGAREWLSQQQTQINTINERTKKHTIDLKKMEKRLNKLEDLK